jgi:hypothetical protein
VVVWLCGCVVVFLSMCVVLCKGDDRECWCSVVVVRGFASFAADPLVCG